MPASTRRETLSHNTFGPNGVTQSNAAWLVAAGRPFSAVPWQSDFNECTNQPVDVTYAAWNNLTPGSTGDPAVPQVQLTYWWPAHRPVYVDGAQWSPTSQTKSGDLHMVTVWQSLSFVVKVKDESGVTLKVVLDPPPSA